MKNVVKLDQTFSRDKYKIDKEIPIPLHDRGGRYHVIIGTLEVGDSFLEADRGMEGTIRAAMVRERFRSNKKFTCRRVAEGLRIWRTT